MTAWSVHTEHRAPGVTDDQADMVKELLAGYGPSAAAGDDRIAVTVTVEADDVQEGAIADLTAIRGALLEARVDDAAAVRVEVIAGDEVSQLAQPRIPDLPTSVQRVQSLVARVRDDEAADDRSPTVRLGSGGAVLLQWGPLDDEGSAENEVSVLVFPDASPALQAALREIGFEIVETTDDATIWQEVRHYLTGQR